MVNQDPKVMLVWMEFRARRVWLDFVYLDLEGLKESRDQGGSLDSEESRA